MIIRFLLYIYNITAVCSHIVLHEGIWHRSLPCFKGYLLLRENFSLCTCKVYRQREVENFQFSIDFFFFPLIFWLIQASLAESKFCFCFIFTQLYTVPTGSCVVQPQRCVGRFRTSLKGSLPVFSEEGLKSIILITFIQVCFTHEGNKISNLLLV